ncbi:unnamed protein product [Clonostachys rosea]|uniref:Uncharacterized protein n=1 Tax=Bionectria ochroleuca TaxID=29856 RepID=A0ABY6UI07_BIOOC|nr:unnamed protein product [Clonostachys rosea]
MPSASSSRGKEPKAPLTISKLNEELNYGDLVCERRTERRGMLKKAIKTFDENNGTKYSKPRAINDFNKQEYKDVMSRMASDFLKEAGPWLWPDGPIDTRLYDESLVWPRDKDKQKNGVAAKKKRQMNLRSRGADSSAIEIDDESDSTPVTPVSSQQRQLPQNVQSTPQSTAPKEVTMEDDDPFISEGEDAGAAQSRNERHQTRPLSREAPSTTSVAPERPAAASHSPLRATAARPNVDNRNVPNSPEEGNLQAHGSSAPPPDNSRSMEVDGMSDDEDMPSLEKILSSPGKGPSNGKGKEKAVEMERRIEMPPPRPPAERAVPVSDSDHSNQQAWPRQAVSSISRFPSQQRGISVFSAVTLGRSPSLRPRAPEASMEDVIDGVTHPSVEIDEVPDVDEGQDDVVTTRKSPLEPEIWFRAIISREPPIEEAWKPSGKFSDKTLADLKEELPFDFEDTDVEGLKFTLKSHEGMKIVQRIDHNNRHDLQHLKRIFGEKIRQAMKERKGRDTGPVTFDIEIETVKCNHARAVGREESLAPLLW